MLQTIELKDYRGFEHLVLENLKPVNLIVGANNVGKTAILEALMLLHGSRNLSNLIPSAFRAAVANELKSTFWDWIIRKGDPDRKACIATSTEAQFDVALASPSKDPNIVNHTSIWTWIHTADGMTRFPNWLQENSTECDLSAARSVNLDLEAIRFGTLHYADKARLEMPRHLRISHRSSHLADPAEVSKLYNDIAPLDADGEDAIQNFMRESIDPRVKRIRYALAPDTRTHLAYVQLAGLKESVPYSQLGQGFASTFHLYCELYANEPDVLLVDEIENGIYYQGLQDFWKGLLAAIDDRGTQLIATTHSFECMRAAHELAKQQSEYPINYIRLDRDPEDAERITVTQFGEAEMDAAIENQWDMR